MPRVVQVASSESRETFNRVSNTYSADTSDSDEALNRNYNQRVNFISEPISTYLRFPVNYSLYNVTYTESENDPYCLRCVIDGRVKKFKKDARVWLHKSSERKRKFVDGVLRNGGNENSTTANKNLKMGTTEPQIISYGGTYRSTPYSTGVGNDLHSEISSLADSDADLTYSEESSPTFGTSIVELREKCREQKSVRFDDTVYHVHTISDDSDESLNDVEKTTSKRNLPDEFMFIEELSADLEAGNESRNNVRAAPVPLDVSKIAPAIFIETESFQESLLDYAVNMHNRASFEETSSRVCSKVKDVNYRKLHATQTMLKMKARKKREDRRNPYYLRSVKETRKSAQVVPASRQKLKKVSHCDGYVKPAAACLDLVSHTKAVASEQMPSCSRVDEKAMKNCIVPTLFILAESVLYRDMKSELNKVR